MSSNRLMEEIMEVNLSYMLLAQQMVREDRDSAMYRLGISQEMADILDQLTPGQISKMAGASTLLCRFRFDDRVLLDMLSGYSRDRAMATSHAAILMAGRPVEALAA